MPTALPHRRIDASPYRVPAPFRCFAVRSDEPAHAWQARAPWGQVHLARLAGVAGLDEVALAALAAAGRARARAPAFGDIVHAEVQGDDIAAAAPGVADLPGLIAGAVRASGVLGSHAGTAPPPPARGLHWLATRGAGFHNDVSGAWSRSLFWLLALAVHDVAFVLPHAGVRLPLAPGDLVLFDPTLAHGLCRPGDGGRAVAASFERGDGDDEQSFLTGELALTDAQWAALGAPWLPVAQQAQRGALDLLVAVFDDGSGAIQHPGRLRGAMAADVCHAEPAVRPDPPATPATGTVTTAAAAAAPAP